MREVDGTRDPLALPEDLPLSGRRVMITGTTHPASDYGCGRALPRREQRLDKSDAAPIRVVDRVAGKGEKDIPAQEV